MDCSIMAVVAMKAASSSALRMEIWKITMPTTAATLMEVPMWETRGTSCESAACLTSSLRRPLLQPLKSSNTQL